MVRRALRRGPRELASHVDVRTTQIYIDVSDQRKSNGIAALEHTPHPLARDAVVGGEA